jgi:hypothetical protein
MDKKNLSILLGVVLLALVGFVAYGALNAPDTRSTGEHVSDAINKLDEGVDDAARELEDRTPLERMQDDHKDATDGSPQ